ncbi:MAG: nitrogen regulation protein NR(I) [alpha proteobacterium MED-G10]|nr:nitrogen regulation protein NR(I) [Rickettsiales bacterium]PDH54768.1 MAG: nitrogen regulation protein NR(I) [alpha proteobacterium MED-G10]|tara:strand:+ start:2002 stop:3426 length:1425 start_codon:yes stop_codon:yes gene_type:complete
MEKRILIIDDDFSLRKVISKALSSSKISVRSVATLSEAWVTIEKVTFDIIICDVMLPDGDGLELVKKVKKKNSEQNFIIISAKNNILTAIKADQLEVFEYLPKPLDLNDLTICVNKCFKSNKQIQNEQKIDEKLPMIGTSLAMQQVYKNIAKITKTNHTVLITGESGTGKELVARAIHNFSPRKSYPFVVINMASLPENLIESELFGYEKGAFTGAEKRTLGYFEKANGGTLFLDEIGDMPIDIQARLLRVLQFGELSRVGGRDIIKTDVRIISATNKDLMNCVENQSFREDLYYRINVINIELPPLRDRENDIVSLSNHFLSKYSENTKQIDQSSLEFLKSYNWPGNVRELENLFKRISVLSSENVISVDTIETLIDHQIKGTEASINKDKNINFSNFFNEFLDRFFDTIENENIQLNLYDKFLNEIEKPLIIKTLKYFKGNQIKTANVLGINRNTLRTKIAKHNLPKKIGKS